ncbi:MAG TPA: cyclic nucleotide-binding domain-containing protein [Solirubrobacteraceae bacterium]
MNPRSDRDAAASPVLSASELSEIAEFGSERQLVAGKLLFQAGEATYDLFVVLEGEVEILRSDEEDETALLVFGPGSFVGGLTLLTGQRRFLNCRATQAGRVLVIAQPEFRRLMSQRP